jgi:hypothetical protein
VWLAGLFIFLFDLVTLTLLSMWLSLRQRRPAQAGVLAVVRVCVIPWVFFGALGAALAIVELTLNTPGAVVPNWEWFFLGAWLVISVANNVVLGGLAWRNLHVRFREPALERGESRAGLRAWWRGRGRAGAAGARPGA